jgi:hypothetical protein
MNEAHAVRGVSTAAAAEIHTDDCSKKGLVKVRLLLPILQIRPFDLQIWASWLIEHLWPSVTT